MSKKIVNQKLHDTLSSTDKEAIFWVSSAVFMYFAFIMVCYFGGMYYHG